MSKRPNFVFFITDQQRADWLGCYGHPVVKTPHIDAIAARGTKFENFHVASPVCMPNRASLMTGRYPTQHGLRYNGCILPQRANTFVDVLAASGYSTAAIGKSHLQPMTEIAPMREAARQSGPVAEAWKPEQGDYSQEEPGQYRPDGRYAFKTPYYGYQHVDMVTGHGDKCGGHYGQWFRDNMPNWRELTLPESELPHNYSCPQAFRTPIPEEFYPTAYIRDRTVDYLAAHAEDDEPFFLFVSFPDPHHPFNPPGRYWDMYSPDDFDVDLPFEAHQNPSPPMRWLKEGWETDRPQINPQTATMTDNSKLKEVMALTAGMVSMIDDAVGVVTAKLKELGLDDNTVVAFNSDHGDYLGDFNMILKGALPFRSITRVPFIWSDPDIQTAHSSHALASTTDIAATVLARAGIEPYNGIMGKSLLGNLNGSPDLREELLVEYNDGGPRLGFEKPARVRSLLTTKYRYTHYRDEDWGELYDLEADPKETNNLWDEPSLLAEKLQLSVQLNNQLSHLMDDSPLSNRLA